MIRTLGEEKEGERVGTGVRKIRERALDKHSRRKREEPVKKNQKTVKNNIKEIKKKRKIEKRGILYG